LKNKLGTTQNGFMSLRKRSQSEYNTVVCDPENSLSSERGSINNSKLIPKLNIKNKFKKLRILKGLKMGQKSDNDKGMFLQFFH